jgi:hypothetical protein
MKKIILTVMGLVFLFAATSFAQSAKVTANVGDIKAITSLNTWTPIMINTIKTANMKDLFIDVSLETGLTTNTKVMSKLLIRDIAEANALVKVRVYVDQYLALPGEVIFDRRKQALIAEFAGDLTNCIDQDGHVIITEDCVLPEMLALILDTMAAHSFNFIATDVPQGLHTIKVEALIDYDNDAQFLDPPYANMGTNAYIGNGSVTVESVRMIKGEDIGVLD